MVVEEEIPTIKALERITVSRKWLWAELFVYALLAANAAYELGLDKMEASHNNPDAIDTTRDPDITGVQDPDVDDKKPESPEEDTSQGGSEGSTGN